MDQRGVLTGDDLSSTELRDALISSLRNGMAAAMDQRASSRQGADAPEALDEIRRYLRDEVLAAIDPGQSTAGREYEMPNTSPDPTVAELRAQLAEARGDTKLAEAISRSDVKHAELIGKVEAGFAELKGGMSTVNVRLDGIEKSTAGLRTAIFGTGVVAVGVVVAILAYGQTWFGIGVSTRGNCLYGAFWCQVGLSGRTSSIVMA